MAKQVASGASLPAGNAATVAERMAAAVRMEKYILTDQMIE